MSMERLLALQSHFRASAYSDTQQEKMSMERLLALQSHFRASAYSDTQQEKMSMERLLALQSHFRASAYSDGYEGFHDACFWWDCNPIFGLLPILTCSFGSVP